MMDFRVLHAVNAESGAAPLFFGRECLDVLADAARVAPRRRKNLDFHGGDSHPAQRCLNAVEPDSYIRPHRHLHPLKDETFLVLRGAFGLVLFDGLGNVSRNTTLRAGGEFIGGNVPAATFHCLVSLETGSIFEAKAGPYHAPTDKDWAPWAPAEGYTDAPAYLAKLRALFK